MSNSNILNNKEFIGTRSTVYSFLDYFFVLMLGWFLHMFLSRSLGPLGYGQFSFVTVIFSILTSCFTPGVALAVTRYTPLSSTPERVLNSGIRIEFIASIFLYIVYFMFLDTLCDFLSIRELKPYLIVMGFIIMPRGITDVSLGYLKGRLKFLTIFRINLLYNVAKVIFCVLLVLNRFYLWGVIWGVIISEMILFISLLYVVKARITRTVSFLKEILSMSLPFWLLVMISFIMQKVDILCIKFFQLDYTQIGYYSAAWRLGEVLLSILSSTSMHILPVFSKAFAAGDFEYVQRSLERSIRYCFLLAMPLCVWIAMHSKEIMSFVFSYKFVGGANVLFIVSIGMLLFPLLAIFGPLLFASGKIIFLISIHIPFILFNLCANILLIPKFGINGAAVATMISLVGIGLVFYIYAYKFKLVSENKLLISKKTFINTIVATLFLGAIGIFFKTSLWYVFGFKTIIAFFSYFGILFLLKEVNNEDKKIVEFLFVNIRK